MRLTLTSPASRYVITGGFGYLLNLVVLLGLIRLAGVDEYAALFPAYVANTASNFLLNRHWTFGAGTRSAAGDLMRYVVVAIVLLFWNYLTFFVFFSLVGLPDAIAQTCSILLGLPVGFTLNRRWAFAAAPSPPE